MKPSPTRVRELLKYNHRTGVFNWREKPYGLRGINNPRNIAGGIDGIHKRKVIRIDQYVFLAQDLVKCFSAPKKKSVFKSLTGINYASDKRAYRVRIYQKNKTISFGYVKNFDEACFLRLAAEQCLNMVSNKTFNYCKNLVEGIK